MTQPIQAVQICYEHPFGAEREVLREFFSFVGCLVKTTMMPVETMLEKHKSLVNPESEQITRLFLTDRPPEGIVLSKNEMWCSFRILKRELTINGKAILRNADQKISAEQFEKAALDAIIHRIWKDDEAETQSLLYINAAFWQLDMFAFLQIKSTFQALKMGELMALPMRGHYYLPEAVYLNKMADTFINMAKQCSVGPSSIYSVYAYVNAQRHLRELLASLEAHAPLRIKLYAAVKPVQELLSELNKIYRVDPDFVSMYCLAATLCEGQAQFALDARPYLRDAIEHTPEELKLFTAGIYLRYSVPAGTKCAFILPDKKMEKESKLKALLERHTLTTIIKLPENLFFGLGVTTSIFIFETGKPQNGRNIKGYYVADDGLETVKNKGRQDVHDKWPALEDYWVKAIQDDNDDRYNTRQLINPAEHLSYQMPEKPFELYEEDFIKTVMDYEMYKRGINAKEFGDKLLQKVLYGSTVTGTEEGTYILVEKGEDNNGED